MSTPVDSGQLEYELAIRGMSALDLARKSRVSPATVSGALAGKRIQAATLRLIAAAIAATPVDEVIVRLIAQRSHSREVTSDAGTPPPG
jgi:transcriptional regulator with XRE-family HTH domain